MPRFKTTFNGYSVKFSPFIENRLAVATAQNFGIIGNGRLHVLEVSSAAVGALLPHHHHQQQQQQQQQCALRL
jgi:peroxin-7